MCSLGTVDTNGDGETRILEAKNTLPWGSILRRRIHCRFRTETGTRIPRDIRTIVSVDETSFGCAAASVRIWAERRKPQVVKERRVSSRIRPAPAAPRAGCLLHITERAGSFNTSCFVVRRCVAFSFQMHLCRFQESRLSIPQGGHGARG
jgi:hypothetical protein